MGNSTVIYRAVEVSDTTSPDIQLVGDEQITIEVNGSFADPGATATDSFEGDLTDQISDSGTVDTTSLGNYTIIYQVSDSSGNTANVSRGFRFRYYCANDLAYRVKPCDY